MCKTNFVVFLNSQMCSHNLLADFLCSSLKADLCQLYLVLNVISVSPKDVSLLLDSVCVMVA